MSGLLPYLVGGSQLLILMTLILFIGLTAPDHDGEPDSDTIGEYVNDAAGRVQDFGARQWIRVRDIATAWLRRTRR